MTILRSRAEVDNLMQQAARPLQQAVRQAAYSILETWKRYGVAVRLDSATGDLVIGKAGAPADEPTQPWPSLIMALEAHLERASSSPRLLSLSRF